MLRHGTYYNLIADKFREANARKCDDNVLNKNCTQACGQSTVIMTSGEKSSGGSL